MSDRLKRALGTASFLVGLAAATGALAQMDRPWVDPPSDGTPVPSATGSTSAVPASDRAGTQPRKEPAATVPESGRSAIAEDDGRDPVEAAPAKKVARDDGSRSLQRKVAAKPKAMRTTERAAARSAQRVERPRVASRPVSAGRYMEGPSGSRLEVMTLRTIQYPDGRRVNVLVRPSPETLRNLSAGLY